LASTYTSPKQKHQHKAHRLGTPTSHTATLLYQLSKFCFVLMLWHKFNTCACHCPTLFHCNPVLPDLHRRFRSDTPDCIPVCAVWFLQDRWLCWVSDILDNSQNKKSAVVRLGGLGCQEMYPSLQVDVPEKCFCAMENEEQSFEKWEQHCTLLNLKQKIKQSRYTPWRYSSCSFSTSTLDGGEWSASRLGRAFPPGKEPLVPIGQEAGWAPEPVWTQRLEENSFAPAGNRTPIAGSSSP
jgi:hypothetical protein